MKNTIIGIVIAVVIMVLLPKATIVESKKQVVITTPPAKVKLLATITSQQRVWLNALRWCESNGLDSNINPKDRDNTPSYGRYQFKPGTFINYKQIYGLTGELMDGEAQERIVEQMIINGGIKWSREFPDCTRKLGTPPKKMSTV